MRFHQTDTEDEIADIFTKGLPAQAHWKHTNTLLRKLPDHVIASSEAAEASTDVGVHKEAKHNGVLLFEGSPIDGTESEPSRYRPIGYG